MSVRLSVIVPCYNEEDNVELLTARIEKVFKGLNLEGEIVFVNDGSQDNTQDKIERLSKKYNNIIICRHEVNKGITVAWKTGLEASSGEYVVTLDADFQYAPEDIALLYQKIMSEKDIDVVQGWRQRGIEERSLVRNTTSIVLAFILGKLFKTELHDVKSGFFITKKEIFAEMLKHRMNYFFFQSFIVISAYTKGYRVAEVPVIFHKRHTGKSFTRSVFITVLKVLWDIPKGILEYRIFLKPKGDN